MQINPELISIHH